MLLQLSFQLSATTGYTPGTRPTGPRLGFASLTPTEWNQNLDVLKRALLAN